MRSVVTQQVPGRGEPIGPVDWLKAIPAQAVASSEQLGWVGLQAVRYRAEAAGEVDSPALTHHRLVLVTRPPDEMDLRFEGVRRNRPAPAGAISLVPAGTPVMWRWGGRKGALHIFLESGLVERVAIEAFDLNP